MMFQKAGWKIRQLVWYRKVDSLEGSEGNFQDYHADSRLSANTSGRTSWLTTRPTTPQRTSISLLSEAHQISYGSTTTAHTSVSSLCNCVCDPNISASSLSGVTVEQTPEILYLPSLPETLTSGDAKTWSLIFSEQPSSLRILGPPCIGRKRFPASIFAHELTFDILEALTIDEHDKTLTSSINMEDSAQDKAEFVTDDVDKLIRKMDEALLTAGNVLADAKKTQVRYHTALDDQVTRTTALPCGISKKKQNGPYSPVKSPISRSKSAVKTKRTAFQRSRGHQQCKTSLTLARSTQDHLAHIGNNMVDVVSGMFRTQVDEMLTPSRLRQMKTETYQKAYLAPSDSEPAGDSISIEPLYLEELSTRGSAATSISSLSSSCPEAHPSTSTSITKDKGTGIITDFQISLTRPGIVYENINFPIPPALPHRSSLRPKPRRAVTLPTIVESFPLTLNNLQDSDSTAIWPSLSRVSTLQYATLRSTPFTLTSPFYRQGPICVKTLRFTREDAIADEDLDWTAFQMAISGNIDEEATENKLDSRVDEVEANQLAQWWDSFAIPLGEMIREKPKRQRMVVYVKDENNKETPLEGCQRVGKRLSAEGGTWGVKMEEHKESRPPSPMAELGEESVVPMMGYNLRCDLEDFLNWEIKHVQNITYMDSDS